MITWHEAEQGTEEWLQARMGLLTASQFKRGMGSGADRETLAWEKAIERKWNVRETTFVSEDMRRGTELEPYARDELEFVLGVDIKEVGLATNSKYPGLGASLDGLIGDDVGVEIKCPKNKTLGKYLSKPGILPAEYRWQVFGQMMICNLKAVHFYAWSDAEKSTPFYLHVTRNDEIITELEAGLQKFLISVKAKEKFL